MTLTTVSGEAVKLDPSEVPRALGGPLAENPQHVEGLTVRGLFRLFSHAHTEQQQEPFQATDEVLEPFEHDLPEDVRG